MATQNENQGHENAKREGFSFGQLFLRAGLTVLLGITFAYWLPSRLSEEMGAQAMARLAAPFSAYLFDLHRKKEIESDADHWNGKDITVLVIDREALEFCKEDWPAHYPFYSRLLSYLSGHAPKGVFIDVILAQSGGQEDKKFKKSDCQQNSAKDSHVSTAVENDDFVEFKRVVASLTSQGTQIFLAARRMPDTNTLVTNKDLDTDNGLKDLRRVGIEFSAHAVDRLAWNYPLVYPAERKVSGKPESPQRISQGMAAETVDPSEDTCPLSAAFSIFKHLYGGKLEVGCEKAAFMSLTWPLDTAADGLLWPASTEEEEKVSSGSMLRADTGDDDTHMYCTSSDSQVKLMLRAEARALYPTTSRPLCVHYRTIHASHLLKGMEGTSTDADLDDIFKNHFVMIGTAFAYSNDLVLTPLQDRIPGVFLHAAALDNLLSRHSSLEDIEDWELGSDLSALRWRKLLVLGAIGFLGIFLIVGAKKKVTEIFLNAHRERSHWKKRFHAHWWRAKLLTAGFYSALSVVSLIVFVIFGVGMILLGAWMHVPFLLVAHVLACTIAIELLEWSEHLYNWISDSKEK